MTSTKKVVKSKTVYTAPNLKRLGAFVIDYIYLYLILAVVISVSRQFFDLENASTAVKIGYYLFLVIVSLAYHIAIPLYYYKEEHVGQTFGKKLMGIKIIRVNGTQVTLPVLAIRAVFELLGEGMIMVATLYVFEILALLGMPADFASYATTAYIMVTLVSAVFMVIKPNRQMFHDYVANTVVILVNQNVKP